MRSKYYILKDKEVVAVGDVTEWAEWFEDANRTVAKTDVGDVGISTVFLGMDHSFGEGPPLIFETMVFGSSLDGETECYSTWDEAEKGHKLMVERVKGEGDE